MQIPYAGNSRSATESTVTRVNRVTRNRLPEADSGIGYTLLVLVDCAQILTHKYPDVL